MSDEAAIFAIPPNGKLRAGRAPNFDHFLVVSVARRKPFDEIEDYCGANHGPSGNHSARLLQRQISGEGYLGFARVATANLADAIIFFAAALQFGFERAMMFEGHDQDHALSLIHISEP